MKTRLPLLLALLLPVAFIAGCSHRAGSTSGSQRASGGRGARAAGLPTVSVSAVRAMVQDIPFYEQGLGTVTALNTVVVKSRVDGQLVKVAFKEGQYVHAGELLAQVDPRPFEVQVQQAEATLARDESQLKVAQVNLARDEKLKAAQVIAQQELDAQSALVGQLQGSVQMDQAQLASAKLNLAYSRITAPISGRVGLRQVDVGNIVHAADTTGIVILTQVQPIAINFTLPEKDLPELRRSMSAGTLKVDAFDSDNQTHIAVGRVEALSNQINTTTGTEQVKAVFDNADNRLWPNQFVNVRVLLRVDRNALVVPAAAISRGPQGTYTFVVQPDQTVKMQPVQVAYSEGNLAVIRKGLQSGQAVVTDGQDRLENGAHVHAQLNQTPALKLQQPRNAQQGQTL